MSGGQEKEETSAMNVNRGEESGMMMMRWWIIKGGFDILEEGRRRKGAEWQIKLFFMQLSKKLFVKCKKKIQYKCKKKKGDKKPYFCLCLFKTKQ